MSESSQTSRTQKMFQEFFDDPDMYFSVVFKKDGTVLKVMPPPDKTLKAVGPIFDQPIKNLEISGIKNVTILSDKRFSPCCIVVDGIRYCWC